MNYPDSQRRRKNKGRCLTKEDETEEEENT
jgi:hypothetical protein